MGQPPDHRANGAGSFPARGQRPGKGCRGGDAALKVRFIRPRSHGRVTCQSAIMEAKPGGRLVITAGRFQFESRFHRSWTMRSTQFLGRCPRLEMTLHLRCENLLRTRFHRLGLTHDATEPSQPSSSSKLKFQVCPAPGGRRTIQRVKLRRKNPGPWLRLNPGSVSVSGSRVSGLRVWWLRSRRQAGSLSYRGFTLAPLSSLQRAPRDR